MNRSSAGPIRLPPTLILWALLSLAPVILFAAPGPLADAPIFLSNAAKPGVILAIDDSDSMDFELLLPTNDGILWWYTEDDSFVGRDENDNSQAGRLNYNQDGTADDKWKKFVYLFPNGYESSYNGERLFRDDVDDHFAVPPVDAYAYTRSPDYNAAYYSPEVTYRPWPSAGAYSFGNADPAAALYDPVYTDAGSLDLTRDFDNNHPRWDSWNWRFKFFPGMRDEDNNTVWSEGLRSVEYFPATYYRPANTDDNTGYNASVECTSCLAPDGSQMDRYEIKPNNYASTAEYEAAIQNFANWFTYYRRRHQAMRGSLALALEGVDATRVGSFAYNNRQDVTMYDMDNSSDRTSLYTRIYTSVDTGWSSTRSALNHAGEQFGRTPSQDRPVQYQCQQNHALLATDGFSSDYTPSVVNSNYDRHKGDPYEDGYRGTLADIAMRYYQYVGSSPSGNVPIPAACSNNSYDPWLDCNDRLHMNTHSLSLASEGFIYGVSHFDKQDAYTLAPNWADPNTSYGLEQVDDLYHASLNGRGEMLDAQNPSQIASKLQQTFAGITARVGSAAAAAFNSATLSSESLLFTSRFDSGDWSGDLHAHQINSDGSLAMAPVWSAAERLDARSLSSNPRSIVTYDADAGVGIPMRWNELSESQKNDLRTDGDGTVSGDDAAASERLDYLRGKRHCELGASSGSCEVVREFRKRGSRLGDLVHSSPVYVGAPSQR
ncbi:MAG: hypothetical protein HUJ29_09605, partial [Gammaproteobacteria bacterium]|nr:hypothetical protein [Gammaproteobacteria bacterium]